MVILLGAELQVGLAMEADVIEVTYEFLVLPAVQNLLECGCELKPAWKLLLMGSFVSYKDNVHSAVHLSQMTFYVSFLVFRGKKQALKKEEEAFFFQCS